MPIKFTYEKEAATKLAQAMKSGDESKIKDAWQGFHKSVADQVLADFKEVQASNDSAILAQRGYRQLTSRETKWYQRVIDALKSNDPKQAFTTIIGTDEEDAIMPETIIQDVYNNLRENHPLLSVIDFTYTAYATKWVLNDHTVQTAVWGTVTAAIAQEITSAFRVVSVDHDKLSAYAIIEKGMLDLGPTFLDGYIRAVLYEALALGLEKAIISGDGSNCPTGLDRDVHEGVSVTSGKYPQKTTGQGKYTVTDFTPLNFGKLVANMAKTEKGRTRQIADLTLICSETDYWSKIMPATTVMNAAGQYVNNVFPVPVNVIRSTQIADNSAILFIPKEYKLFLGANSRGVIEYSDEYKFIEDQRVFKIKTYASGQAFDNTSALLLDITDIEPAFLNVKVNGGLENTTTVSGSVSTTSGLEA